MEQQSREKQIRARAHQLWEQEGRPEGQHQRHWEEASREIETSEKHEGPSSSLQPGNMAANDAAAPDEVGFGSGKKRGKGKQSLT